MFGFMRQSNKQQDKKTAEDQKIREMMNEVGQELGVDSESRQPLSQEKAKKLGNQLKNEIQERTSK